MTEPLPLTEATVAAFVADSAAFKQKMLEDRALLRGIARTAEVCVAAYRAGNKILIAGNGGSAADAQHFAAELVARFEFDRPGLPAIALTTDTSALTAIGNDYGYERLFSRQVEALGRPGDVFIGLSTSGNSKNILKAMEVAQAQGLIRVAMCGLGGRIHEMAEHVLAMPSTHTPRIQEGHGLAGHIICAMIEDQLFAATHKAAKA
jgi:D-sedoheptulose 7-phosphate isomerase